MSDEIEEQGASAALIAARIVFCLLALFTFPMSIGLIPLLPLWVGLFLPSDPDAK